MHARGLRLRGASDRLASIDGLSVAFRFIDSVGAPKPCFRSSIPGLHIPLSTLNALPHGRPPMTRGRCGSLAFTVRLLPSRHLAGLSRRTNDRAHAHARTLGSTGHSPKMKDDVDSRRQAVEDLLTRAAREFVVLCAGDWRLLTKQQVRRKAWLAEYLDVRPGQRTSCL